MAGIAFDQEWVEYDPHECPSNYLLKNPEKDLPQIRRIQAKLVHSLRDDDGDDGDVSEDEEMPDVPEGNYIPAISEATMWSALHRNNLAALRFVAYSLDLSMDGAKTKAHFCDKLMTWVSNSFSSGRSC
jgi:hypothetical protein